MCFQILSHPNYGALERLQNREARLAHHADYLVPSIVARGNYHFYSASQGVAVRLMIPHAIGRRFPA